MTEEEWRKKFDKEADNDVDAISFENGMNWCRKNPAPEVLKLVEACHAILNESARAKENGCAITNVCLKGYLEPVLKDFKKSTGGE